MIVINLSDKTNPDKNSISAKRPSNVELSAADITSSNFTPMSSSQFIKLNYANNGVTIQIDRYAGEGFDGLPDGFSIPKTLGTIYYTPLYTEKIDYKTWLNTVNKNFSELN